MSDTSSIDTNDSANYLNDMMSRFGLEHHLDLVDNQEYDFDLIKQVTLHIGADGGGIVGNAGEDSGTVRTDYSTPNSG